MPVVISKQTEISAWKKTQHAQTREEFKEMAQSCMLPLSFSEQICKRKFTNGQTSKQSSGHLFYVIVLDWMGASASRRDNVEYLVEQGTQIKVADNE